MVWRGVVPLVLRSDACACHAEHNAGLKSLTEEGVGTGSANDLGLGSSSGPAMRRTSSHVDSVNGLEEALLSGLQEEADGHRDASSRHASSSRNSHDSRGAELAAVLAHPQVLCRLPEHIAFGEYSMPAADVSGALA